MKMRLLRTLTRRLYEEHPKVTERIRNTVNQLFEKDPTYRKRIGEGVQKAYEKDPTIKVRLREASKELWKDPDFRERCLTARRKASENPDLAMKQRQIQKDKFEKHPEMREEISRRMREYLSKPGKRAFVCSSDLQRKRPDSAGFIKSVPAGIIRPEDIIGDMQRKNPAPEAGFLRVLKLK